MSKDKFEDAEFEAFLEGKGELAQQLKGLSQPEPSAELDAAILAAIEIDMAKTGAASSAANDPVIPGGRRNFFVRWSAPLATAASVVFAFVLLMPQMDRERTEPVFENMAPAAAVAPEAKDMSRAETEMRPTAAKADRAVREARKARSRDAEGPAKEKASAPAPRAELLLKQAEPSASTDKHAVQESLAEAGKPAAPSVSIPAAPAAMAVGNTSGSSGLRARAMQDAPASPASLPPKAAPPQAARSPEGAQSYYAAAAPAAGLHNSDGEAKSWLGFIEELLKANAPERAFSEWEKFRKAYPEYVVPEKLEAQLKALKKPQ